MEFWQPDGDVLVYLQDTQAQGQSPSFRVASSLLHQQHCTQLISMLRPISFGQESPDIDAYELRIVIPKPFDCAISQNQHVAVRNFFAWMNGIPLQGNRLGLALVNLLDTMRSYRSSTRDHIEDLLLYTDQMGYAIVQDQPTNALAMLHFAEVNKLGDVWVDAFSHCAGMDSQLIDCLEFQEISKSTKAAISRASLAINVKCDQVSKAMSNFLEEDLSDKYLGLPQSAREHLEAFRSFLAAYYIKQHSYWPPMKFSRHRFNAMHSDFRSLYDFLADHESLPDTHNHTLNGLCVRQNIAAFDLRHDYEPQPCTSSLLPKPLSVIGRNQAQKFLPAFRFNTKEGVLHRTNRKKADLLAATNHKDTSTSPLVQSYLAFEFDHVSGKEDGVSSSDARKVRWILIYAVLQTLESVLRAPRQVRNPDESNYLLCIPSNCQAPWTRDSFNEKKSLSIRLATPERPRSATISIHPDVESFDYFHYLPSSPPKTDVVAKPTGPAEIMKSSRMPSFRSRRSDTALNTLTSRDSESGLLKRATSFAQRRRSTIGAFGRSSIIIGNKSVKEEIGTIKEDINDDSPTSSSDRNRDPSLDASTSRDLDFMMSSEASMESSESGSSMPFSFASSNRWSDLSEGTEAITPPELDNMQVSPLIATGPIAIHGKVKSMSCAKLESTPLKVEHKPCSFIENNEDQRSDENDIGSDEEDFFETSPPQAWGIDRSVAIILDGQIDESVVEIYQSRQAGIAI